MSMEGGKETTSRPFRTSRWIAWGLAGISWFIWLGYEDQGLTPIMAVSGVIAFAIGLEVYARRGSREYPESEFLTRLSLFIRGIGIGTLSGALVGPLVLFLATLKNALHQHEGADFSTDDLIMVVDHIVFWAVAGGLFGTAASILELSKRWSKDDIPAH
jgi:hypothetical protein